MSEIGLSDSCGTAQYFLGAEETSDASPRAGKPQKIGVFVQTLDSHRLTPGLQSLVQATWSCG